MITKYVQSTPAARYGCGSYALANIFNDPRFTEQVPETQGEHLPDLQKKMNRYKRAIFINPVFITSQNLKSGNRLKYSQADAFGYAEGQRMAAGLQGLYRPFLVIVANSSTSMHTIAVIHDCRANNYIVVNSSNNQPIILTIKELIAMYHITAVCWFSLWAVEDKGNFVMMRREELAHIFE